MRNKKIIIGLSIPLLLLANSLIGKTTTNSVVNNSKEQVKAIEVLSSSEEYYPKSLHTNDGPRLMGELHDLMVDTHSFYTSYKNHCGNGDVVYQIEPGSDSNHITEFYSQTDIDRPWNPTKKGHYNREHVWCQSHSNSLWGEKGGGSDLHHIRPVEYTLNSARNNTPYGIVSKHDATTMKRTTAASDGTHESSFGGYLESDICYEPIDNVKGDVARILMYLYVHYSSFEIIGGTKNDPIHPEFFGSLDINSIVHTSSGKTKDAWDLLITWSEEDPVSEQERYRNEGVYSIQGNRNPFIDHPEFARTVFSEGVEYKPIRSIRSELINPSGYIPYKTRTISPYFSTILTFVDGEEVLISKDASYSLDTSNLGYQDVEVTFRGYSTIVENVKVSNENALKTEEFSYFFDGYVFEAPKDPSETSTSALLGDAEWIHTRVAPESTPWTCRGATATAVDPEKGTQFGLANNSYQSFIFSTSSYTKTIEKIRITSGGTATFKGLLNVSVNDVPYKVGDKTEVSIEKDLATYTFEGDSVGTIKLVWNNSKSPKEGAYEGALCIREITVIESPENSETLLQAKDFARYFLSNIASVCDPLGKNTDLNVLQSMWQDFEQEYLFMHRDSRKAFLNNNSDEDIVCAREAYSYIVNKYHSSLNAFVNEKTLNLTSANEAQSNDLQFPWIAFFGVVGLCLLCGLGYFIYRKIKKIK